MDIAFTGKSQQSTLDVQSKKETQFLERYSRYIVRDECNTLFTDQQAIMLHTLDPKRMPHDMFISLKTQHMHNDNVDGHVFFALREVSFSQFSSYYDKVLEQFNIYQKDELSRSIRTQGQTKTGDEKRKLFRDYQPRSFNEINESQVQFNFFELYSNQLSKESDTIKQGEIVIFESRIKCTSKKTKELSHDIKRLIDYLFKPTVWDQINNFIKRLQNQKIQSEYQSYLDEQKPQIITLIILFNGDVNYDFQENLKINSIQINNVTYLLKLKVYYVSKQSLFNHFRETNNQQKIECINDKIVTFYDMNRKRQQKMKIVKEIDKIKKEQNEVQNTIQKQLDQNAEKQKKDDQFRFYVTTITLVSFIILGGCFLLFKKRLAQKF